jgi:hypothetical protein
MKDLVINKESERQVRDAFLKAFPTQTDGITAVCVAQLTDLHLCVPKTYATRRYS